MTHTSLCLETASRQGEPIPRTGVTHDRQGGWNLWIWE